MRPTHRWSGTPRRGDTASLSLRSLDHECRCVWVCPGELMASRIYDYHLALLLVADDLRSEDRLFATRRVSPLSSSSVADRIDILRRRHQIASRASLIAWAMILLRWRPVIRASWSIARLIQTDIGTETNS